MPTLPPSSVHPACLTRAAGHRKRRTDSVGTYGRGITYWTSTVCLALCYLFALASQPSGYGVPSFTVFFLNSLLYPSLHESQTHVAEDDLEFLILLPTPPSRDYRCIQLYPGCVLGIEPRASYILGEHQLR